ncbi:MAG TPA: carboxylating nicotinate-nucleotide diphosphorylase [Candidatus Dormibacteraeota bacterium]|nr:carboxylating nicotinate-nucleotide diphosphorylase [Candidatus Dormibacteraeota bacterium]
MREVLPPAGLTQEYLVGKVWEALDEDAASRDVTTAAVVPPDLWAEAELRAGAEGVVAGLGVVEEAFRQVDAESEFHPEAVDGDRVAPGEVVARVRGPLGGLLRAERTALNFLQQLSGVATLTRRYVDAAGPGVAVLDTRKTVAGLRPLQRHAVRAGGGVNHRLDLAGAVLIKDNHVAAAGGTAAAIRLARGSGLPVEVEVETLDELDVALAERAELVLLDNMPPGQVAEAVRRTAGRAVLEVSGGVTLDTIADYAATGVDRISVGALTHSAPALDVSMEVTRSWRQ